MPCSTSSASVVEYWLISVFAMKRKPANKPRKRKEKKKENCLPTLCLEQIELNKVTDDETLLVSLARVYLKIKQCANNRTIRNQESNQIMLCVKAQRYLLLMLPAIFISEISKKTEKSLQRLDLMIEPEAFLVSLGSVQTVQNLS